MFKYKLFILTFSAVNCLFSTSDTALRNKSLLNLELGYSSTMFFGNYSGKRFNKNTSEFGISFIKLGFSRNRLSFTFNYKEHSEHQNRISGTDPQPGFIISRSHNIIDAGVAYMFQIKKLKLFLEPSVLLSGRLDGDEIVIVEKNSFHLDDYHLIAYYYRSYGLGLGINLRQHLYRQFYLAFEVQYNHFFESKKAGFVRAGFEEFDRSYKVNKDLLTPIFKVGYQISFGK